MLPYLNLAISIFCIFLCDYTQSSPKRGKSITNVWWDTFNETHTADKGSRNFQLPIMPLSTTNLFNKKDRNACDPLNGWRCTPYHECSTFAINDDPTSPVTLRSGSEDLKCPLHLEVCCRMDKIVRRNGLLTRSSNSEDYSEHESNECGIRNEEGVSIAITGIKDTDTQFGEFPWMIAVLRFETISAGSVTKEIDFYICAGSLIKANVVLTAAHCVMMYLPENLKIRAGEWDTQQTYELLPYQEVALKNIVAHPNFDAQSLRHDFALLELQTPLGFYPHIAPICLPSWDEASIYEYHTCYASGWGKDTFEGTYQNILKKVHLNLVDRASCQKALRTTRLGRFFRLHRTFVCAGGEAGVDTCKGDGGAPLVCLKELGGPFFQVGIVAWGIGCGEEGIPGVYADVSTGIEWINAELKKIEINAGNDGDDGEDGGKSNLVDYFGDYF